MLMNNFFPPISHWTGYLMIITIVIITIALTGRAADRNPKTNEKQKLN